MRRFLEGMASPWGFMIKEGWNWVSSKDFFSFKSKINIVNDLFEFLVSIALIFLWGLMVFISHSELNIVRLVFCFIIYLFYVYKWVIEIVERVFIKTHRQWHSCEHKVINLIRRGQKPILENLRSMSPLHSACDSQDYFTRIVSGFAVCLLLVLTKINLFLCLGAGAGIWFLLFFLSDKIIFPTQYLILKEPTAEQYEEALRVAREFLVRE